MRLSVSKIVSFCAILLLAVSCVSLEDVKIHSVKDVRIEKMSEGRMMLALSMDLENPNRMALTIKNADLKVVDGSREIGKIKQIDPFTLQSQKRQLYEVKLTVELTDASAPLMAAFSFLTGKKPDIRLKGNITAGSFLFSRTVPVDQKIPLNF